MMYLGTVQGTKCNVTQIRFFAFLLFLSSGRLIPYFSLSLLPNFLNSGWLSIQESTVYSALFSPNFLNSVRLNLASVYKTPGRIRNIRQIIEIFAHHKLCTAIIIPFPACGIVQYNNQEKKRSTNVCTLLEKSTLRAHCSRFWQDNKRLKKKKYWAPALVYDTQTNWAI